MKIAVFKQHFYKYISKAEFAMALSAVVGTIGTNFVSGYSSYLTDRNDRIERLNKKPLNYIYVDCISFDDYQKMIDRRNWKPANLRPKQDENSSRKKIIQKEQIITTVNEWLAKNTKKNNSANQENEVSTESLQQLEKDNNFIGNDYTLNVQEQDIETTENNTTKDATSAYVNVVSKISGKKNNNLPPMKKKEKEQMRYFIVQDSTGRKYNPRDYSGHTTKQRIQLKESGKKKPIGTIAGHEIEKDDNIFQSLLAIWRTILFIKTDKNNQIINSNYDQYGNRITKVTQRNQEKQSTKRIIGNITGKNRNETHNGQEDIQLNFIVPTFHIDGNLQKMTEYNKFKEIATENNLSAFELQTLSYLEYAFEDCWHKQFNDKYGNNYINALFSVAYTQNGEVYEIKLESLNTKLSQAKQKMFKEDIVNLLTSCDITEIKNLSKDNYRLWGKVKIKFTKN